jgi:autotransporter-associated beta strand protein
VVSNAQTRTDNRRLFWTGSAGAVWDNSTASWMATGSYLSYATRDYAGLPGEVTWVPCDALPGTPFLAGDVVIFDSRADTNSVWTGSSWRTDDDDPVFGSTRTIEIASEGVTASDVIVYASAPSTAGEITRSNNYIFTGGAITADPTLIDAGDTHLTGTGVGLAAGSVTPIGRLIKTGAGVLTLSNTAANHFPGGIHLLDGTLSVTTPCALGDNNIITNYVATSGNTTEAKYSAYFGEKLLPLIMQPGGAPYLPAVVLDYSGRLLSGVGTDPTLHFAETADGIDVTGDIYLASRLFTLQVDGTATATITGNIIGTAGNYGSSGGTLIKTGAGTLVLSGTRNLFYGTSKNYSRVDEGRVVATSPTSLGTGAWQIAPGSVLEFRGVKGTVRQAFIGGGDIEITNNSDLTFDWRSGTLDGYDGMSGNGSWHPAKNEISNLTISGRSRFTALASGTYSEVLGGPNVAITVKDASTLVLGREGLTARGSGATKIPMTYAILANRIDLEDASTLVLNPNAYLSTGALIFTDDSICSIAFGASGVSRLRVQESNVNPDDITTTSDTVRYIVPDGMKLTINEIPIPVAPGQSIPNDNSSEGWCREYILVNQGANPLKDIALTLNALDALHDTLYSHLADELVDPVTRHAPARSRRWVNEGWVRYISSRMDYDRASITTPGVEGRVNGLVIGADALLPGRVLLGIHGTIADNTLDTTNDTSISSKHKTLGIHAAQSFGKFYLSAAADTGRASTISYRTEAGNLVRGRWDTSYYTGAVQIGAAFTPWQNTVLKPFAGLRYAKLKISGHNETGSNFSPMEVRDFDDASAQAAYGIAIGRKFNLFKREFAADLSLARKHSIRTPRETLAVRYYDSPDTPVTLERGEYYDDITAIGLSARAALSKHTIVGLALDYEVSSGYSRTTASILTAFTW